MEKNKFNEQLLKIKKELINIPELSHETLLNMIISMVSFNPE